MKVPTILALALWAIGLVLLARGLVVSGEGPWAVAQLALGGLAFGIVGLLLSVKTANSIGWLFLGIQASFGMSLIGLGGPEIVLTAAVLLVFPSGHIPGRRWWVAVAALLFAGAMAVVDVLVGINDDYSWLAFMAGVVPVMIASALRIVNDYRKAEGQIRQQLKWLAWVLIVGGLILLASTIPARYVDDAHDLAGLVLLIGSPIAVGLAVTRYRLYEIDRIVSRTISYTLVAGALLLVFAAMAVWIPQALSLDDPLFVAGATLAAAALFNPLRRTVQSRVDRRFNRSKYDAERVAAVFTESLKNEVDAKDLVDGWVSVVSGIMEPAYAGVWVKETR